MLASNDVIAVWDSGAIVNWKGTPMASGGSSGSVNASLTDEELALLAQGLAEKKRPTVYLREAIPSLGLPEGSSARVLAISGRSLTVKPRGVDDELPFEAEEVRFTRKPPAAAPRKRAPRKAAPAPAGGPAPMKIVTVNTAAPKAAAKTPAAKTPAVKTPAAKTPAAKVVVTAPAAGAPEAAVTAGAGTSSAETSGAGAAASKQAPVRQTRARRGPATVSVTIEGSAENEWTVTVMRGAKRVGKPSPAPADAVGRAIEALGDENASAEVTGLLDAAREQAEQRVAELARQLEEAQRALESLGSI